jgi:hypothetical protein
MKDNTNKKITDYIKELKPIIKKYGLENDENCIEAIKRIKNNDLMGYHSLVLFLYYNVELSSNEQQTIFETTKKAVENGLENAWFCYGLLLLLGIGVQQDANQGIFFTEQAFLKVFSKAFIQYPLESGKAQILYYFYNTFIWNLDSISNVTSLDEMKDIVYEISKCYNIVCWASEMASFLNGTAC